MCAAACPQDEKELRHTPVINCERCHKMKMVSQLWSLSSGLENAAVLWPLSFG
eukprot:COSAG01_NODE_735_length_13969_cov_357.018241_19_plen_53_part_00